MASQLTEKDRLLLDANLPTNVGLKPYEDGLWGSQGNKDFNNPENHVQTDEVDSNSIHPFNVSKSDMEKLNKEERLSVLNRGLSVMTGFSS